MPRLNFGAFLAPHHPVGEHPMLQFRRDLDLVEQLDQLGYDEFWCGEHHSSGWEMIGSPEMFLAAAGERSKRIKLATGVVSLPYHHPFNVAQRMVQLDWMTGGRAIFGSGPGALASDAHTLGIDPMVQRDRQDEAIGVIRRLMQRRAGHREERLVHPAGRGTAAPAAAGGDAVRGRLADQPVGHDPRRQARHRRHLDRLAVGGGPQRAADAMGLRRGRRRRSTARPSTARTGACCSRWHIAETREKALAEARQGLLRHHNEYIVGTLQRPGATPFKDPDEAVEKTAFGDGAAATIGTPDDLVARIKSGARDERRLRHRRRLCPRLGQPGEHDAQLGHGRPLRRARRSTAISPGCASRSDFVATNRGVFDRAKEAIMAKITENEAARRRARQDQGFAARRRRLGQQRHRLQQGPRRREVTVAPPAMA